MTKEHSCSKEKQLTQIFVDISEIKTIVHGLDKALMGNGQKGMFTKVTEFEGALKLIWIIISVFGLAGCAAVVKALLN